MKKRVFSMLLVFCMLVSMLPVTVLADTEQIKHYSTPTNARWDGYDMIWDWTNDQTEQPTDIEVWLYYCAGDESTPPDENTDWGYSTGWQRFSFGTTPSLGDFNITQTGWYCYEVNIVREEWYGDKNQYYKELISEFSKKSKPVYFGGAEALSTPTNLAWDGSNMTWTMSNVSNVDYFELRVTWSGESANGTTEFVYPQNNQTSFSYPLEEVGGEDWLLRNGNATYEFRVRAVSKDATEAADSEWADCTGTLNFNASAQRLTTPTDLAWNGYTMSWAEVTGAASYDVELWYQRTEGLTPEEELEYGAAGGSSAEIFSAYIIEEYKNVKEFPALNNSVLHYRAGDYWFKVRANADLSKNLSSEWSGESSKKAVNGRFGLDTPTSPTWNTETGAMTWSWNGASQQEAALRGFQFEIYYRADQNAAAECVSQFSTTAASTSSTRWKERAEEDGYYSFRVCAISDDRQSFDDSDWSAMSGEYYYDAPDAIPAPENVAWSGSSATWTPVGDASLVDYYYVNLYYLGQDGQSDPQYVGGCNAQDSTSHLFTTENFSEYGNGVYRFEVQAFSKDTTVASHSDTVQSPTFTYTVPTAQMDAPAGLRWDGNSMKWDIPTDTTGIAYYDVEYYGDNGWYGAEISDLDQFPTIDYRDAEYLGNNITFKVRSVSADATRYKDSDWVTCQTYYVPPAGLPIPTDVKWDSRNMSWSWNGDESQLSHFVIYIYYAESASSEPVYVSSLGTDITSMRFEQWAQYAEKSGLYSFTVRAYSNDPNTVSHSNESDISGTYQYTLAEPLAAPTNAAWDGSTATWTASEDDELVDYYRVCLLYRYPGESQWEEWGEYDSYDGSNRYVFLNTNFRDGCLYQFRVCAVSGDMDQRSNSAYATSATTFTYQPADNKLSAPGNLRMNGRTMQWDAVTNDALVGYKVQAYGVDTDVYSNYTVMEGTSVTLGTNALGRLGSRIQFRVYAMSGDLNNIGNSDWSEFTDVYTVSSGDTATHSVTFMDGTTQLDQKGITHGVAINKPADPTKNGYTFAGWYTDAACTIAYNFNTPVTENLTLYAKWTENSTVVEPDYDDDDDYYVPIAPSNPTVDKEVTENKDGSTTTTETKKDGTIIETTENTDGSTVTTETKTEVKETATSTTTTTTTETVTKDANGNKETVKTEEKVVETADTTTTTTKTETKTDAKTETVEVVETVKVDENGNETTTVETKTETKLDNGSTGTTTVASDGTVAAEAKVTAKAVAEAAKEETAVTLPIASVPVTSKTENAPTVDVSVPASAGEVTVEIPVENVTPGTVVVLVDEDGNETVVNTTGTTENGVVVNVEGNVTVKVVDNSKDFQDVTEDDWYNDATAFASSRELMNGMTEDTFGHNVSTSRAMVAQILHNMEGKEDHSFDGSFNDVDEDDWHADAVHWAAENDIISGTGNGNFDPMAAVTREQLAVMLWKYAGSEDSDHHIGHFNDDHEISSWAEPAMRWAVENGLMSGKGNGQLDPKGEATRAEVASVLMNFYKNVKY